MRNFLCGLIVGLTLAGTLAYAGNLYNSKGQPAAPYASVQQSDYFRQRQSFLDVAATRKAAEQMASQGLSTKPCTK